MKTKPVSNGMSPLVRTVCGWIKGFILLYGIQIIFYGHLTPGGGFAGGVIAASAFVLITLAEGEEKGLKVFSQRAASIWESVGVLTFVLMAGLGLVFAGMFFVNIWPTSEAARYTLFSGGIIPLCNVGIGLKVCSSLYLAFVVLSALHLTLQRDPENDGGKS